MTTTQNLPRRSRVKKSAAEVDVGKVGKLIRLLASDKPGEVVAAASALQRTLQASGRDLHDVADIVEAGLRPAAQPPRAACWGPPLPSPHDWVSMSWYLHYHRHQLRSDQAEFVADMLLGQGDAFDDGRILNWAVNDLRAMVARVQAELRSTDVVRR